MRSISRVALIALAAVMYASGQVYSLEISSIGNSVGSASLGYGQALGQTNSGVTSQYNGAQAATVNTQVGGKNAATVGSAGAYQSGQGANVVFSQDAANYGSGVSQTALQTQVGANNKGAAYASGINTGIVGAAGTVGSNVNSYVDNSGSTVSYGAKGPNSQVVAEQTNSASSAGNYGQSQIAFGSNTNTAVDPHVSTGDSTSYGDASASGKNAAGVAGISNDVVYNQAGYKQQYSATNQAQGIGGIVVTNSQNGAGAQLSTSASNQGIASYGQTAQQGTVNSNFAGYGDANSFNSGAAATQNIGVAIGAKGTVTTNKNTGVIYSNAGAANLVGQYKAY